MSKFNSNMKYDRMVFGGPTNLVNQSSNAGNQWFGKTVISSDTAGYSVTISTNLVGSASLVVIAAVQVAGYQVGSQSFGAPFVVSTISPSGFFKLANANSWAMVGSGWLGWKIEQPLV